MDDEVAAREWIEAVTQLRFTTPASIHRSLRSGVLLLLLANKLRPGCAKIKQPSHYAFAEQAAVCKENLKAFVDAMKDVDATITTFDVDSFYGGDGVAVAAVVATIKSIANSKKLGGVVGVEWGSKATTSAAAAASAPSSPATSRSSGAALARAHAATTLQQGAYQAHLSVSGAPQVTGKHAEARQIVLRKLVPEIIQQNAQLKGRLLELEEKYKEAQRQNNQLQVRLAELTTRSDSGDGLIMGNYNGKVVVKAATPEKLLDAVYNPNHQTSVADFAGVFLLTYHAWTDAATVILALRTKFEEAAAAAGDDGGSNDGKDMLVVEQHKQTVLRIVNFLKAWIDNYFVDLKRCDAVSMEKFMELLALVRRYSPQLGDMLDKCVKRQQAKAAAQARLRQALLVAASTAAATAAAADDDGSPEARLRREAEMSRRGNRLSAPLAAAGGGAAAADDVVAAAAAAGEVHVFNTPPPEPILPKQPITKATAVEIIDATELARQLTLLQFALFTKLEPHELLGLAFSSKEKMKRAPNVMALTEQFNDISHWVMYSMCTVPDLKKRSALLKKFVLMAEALRKLNNLNGVFALVAGLSGAPVHRMKKTWEVITGNKKYNDMWEHHLELTNPLSSFSKYRQAKQAIEPPAIPYLGVYLQDLTFIEEGNKDRLENGYVNFVKQLMVADVIHEVQKFQHKPYNLMAVTAITEYLQGARQIDEEKLFKLSLQMEPRQAPQTPR